MTGDEESTPITDLFDPQRTAAAAELQIAKSVVADQRLEIARLNEDVKRLSVENGKLKLALNEARVRKSKT